MTRLIAPGGWMIDGPILEAWIEVIGLPLQAKHF